MPGPAQEVVDAVENLLERMRVGPEHRALLYRQLLERQLLERQAQDRAAAAAAPRKKTVPKIAHVVIYDADGVVLPGTERDVRTKIADTLAKLGAMTKATPGTGLANNLGFRFDVIWREGEPNASAKAATRPLTYPIYIYPDDRSAARLVRALDDHGYPRLVPGSALNIRDHVRMQWGSLRGTAAPPGTLNRSYKKCAFIRQSVIREGGTDPTLIANTMLHELGHLCNIMHPPNYAHPKDDSVMRTRTSTSEMMVEVRGYNSAHAGAILKEVSRQWGFEFQV
jgi:hypothetical protein